MVQHTRGRDDDVDDVAMPTLRLDVPHSVFEPAARDRVAEAGLLLDVVLARDPLEIALDLAARREPVAPVGRGRERIGIEVGRDIAREPRVGVLPPRSAEPICLLVDRDVGEPGFLQLDRAQDARHPGADDRETQLAVVVDQPRPLLSASRPSVIRPCWGYLISC